MMDFTSRWVICILAFLYTVQAQDTCGTDCIQTSAGSIQGSTCGWLRDPSKYVYHSRRYICNHGFAPGCQETCTRVLSVTTSTRRAQTTTQASVVDTCISECLWVGDGTASGSTCSWLLDQSRPEYYTNRAWYCTNRFASGCEATCSVILNDPSATTRPRPSTPEPIVQTTPVATTTAPQTQDGSCVDGIQGVHIMDGGYSCKYLTKQYPEDQIRGIYKSRKALCAYSTTDCCASCKIVAEEFACVDEAMGVQTLDGAYSCKYLTGVYPEDEIRGIYASRHSLCASSLTKCCQACKTVAMETVCVDETLGVEIMDGAYSCKYLTQQYPEDALVGIYESRHAVCSNELTRCCASCKQVRAECRDGTLGIQSMVGSYSCKYLTQYYPEDKFRGFYASRRSVCDDPMTDCCASCAVVANEFSSSTVLPNATVASTTSQSPTTGVTTATTQQDPTTTVAPTPAVTTAQPIGCRDDILRLSKLRIYSCNELTRPQSNIYTDRASLCQTYSSQCCLTCLRVNKEKPSGNVKYNINGALTETTPSSTKPKSPVDFYKILQEHFKTMQRTNTQQVEIFRNLFSMFSSKG